MKKDNDATTEPGETPDPAKAFEASKKAFEEAVAKTKAEGGEKPEEEKVVVEAVPHEKPKAAKKKAAPKPAPTAEVDLSAKLAEMERKLEEATRKTTPPPPDPLKLIQERLSEKFGEEEGATLAETFGDLVKPLLDKTAAMERMLIEATERGRKQSASANHKRIAKDYGQLKGNDAALGMIDMQVEALIAKNPNKFTSLDEAYDHVVEALYGEAEAEETDEDDGDAEAIEASAVTVPDKKTKERKLTPLEKSRMVFNQLVKDPDNVSAATRLARELKIG